MINKIMKENVGMQECLKVLKDASSLTMWPKRSSLQGRNEFLSVDNSLQQLRSKAMILLSQTIEFHFKNRFKMNRTKAFLNISIEI